MKSTAVTSILLSFLITVSGLPVDTSTVLTKTIEKRELYGDTSNELANCAAVTLIFARGTLEPGNIGLLAGPPFFDVLSAELGGGNLGVQGVPYGATILGYLEQGDPAGSATFAQLTEQAASQCPDTQIVLSGYSQGAQLVHNGVGMISAAVASRVKAVVLFGDPFDGQPFPNINEDIVKTFCFSTDLICYDTIFADPAHLSYSLDATPAALFVASLVTP
ncbi:hypothetical protein MMC18_000700 [Xylographa bjoerkii]|nr:hypothetical protein [Xylographa bjoerkii]